MQRSSSDLLPPLPRDQAGRPKCPLDPYFIMPDKCKCVDFQTLKLQELPDAVPHGEMPRHMQLYCDRYVGRAYGLVSMSLRSSIDHLVHRVQGGDLAVFSSH